jgi:hypothetical protein
MMFGLEILSEWMDRISGDEGALIIDLHGLDMDLGGEKINLTGKIKIRR